MGEHWAVAAAAMARAGVKIRALDTLETMTTACRLLDDVWEIPPDEASEVRPSLLRGLDHAGSYLTGAYLTTGSRTGTMVAASVGFFAAPSDVSMHSHITGVLAGSGHGIGSAIKWHQRAWALDRGLRRITWTYDPLIARNAFFNITRLGARPERYFVDFYGPMDDGPNRGQPTDRADAIWDLRSDSTCRAAADLLGSGPMTDGPDADALRAAGAGVALAVGASGEPEVSAPAGGPPAGPAGSGPTGPGPTGPGRVLIGVPADIEAIRRSDQGRALRWRLALRTALAPLLADDAWRVTGFAKSGWYVLDRGGNA